MTDLIHDSYGGERPEPYHYTDSGLENIWLIGGVEHHETAYGTATSVADTDDLHRVIAMDIIESTSMSGPEFRFLRTELELSQRALATLLKTTEQCIHRWENGKTAEIPGPAQVLLGGIYVESNSDSRLKEHLEILGKIDTVRTELERRMFENINEHWTPAAA